MYASDYALSLGTEAKNMTTGTYTNRDELKTGWMYLWNANNDSSAPDTSHEWTISRYNSAYSGNIAYTVYSDGRVAWSGVDSAHSVCPVFYLNSEEEIVSGTGTTDDPYIIGN